MATASVIVDKDQEDAFKKTHRRNESKLSRISHMSIKSLRGNKRTNGGGDWCSQVDSDEDDDIDDDYDEDDDDVVDGKKTKKYLMLLGKRLPCLPRLRIPDYWSQVWHFTSHLEWRSSSKYTSRILVVGNKFSDHLFRALDVDLQKVQSEFGGPKKANAYCTSKYSLLTFLPLNIFEQFRRLANLYFLFTLVLTLVLKDISPISPTSWVLSLMFVIVVTMLKQGYEDFLRHRSDIATNKRKVCVLRNGQLTDIRAEDITVGDIVYLQEDDQIPCDLVVLSTSHDQGQCYSMTANLDGETSLKTRWAAPLTKNLLSVEAVDEFVGCVECENPNPKLDSFLGRMFAMDEGIETCSLSTDNILLTGAQLSNTAHVFGVCVYAGKQTKIHLNSRITQNKFSTVERTLNRYLVFFVLVLVIELAVSTVLTLSYGVEYVGSSKGANQIAGFILPPNDMKFTDLVRLLMRDDDEKGNMTQGEDNWHWYIGPTYSASLAEGVMTILIWMVLYNYIIPISLYVTLEVQKFLGSMMVEWDIEMYDADRNIAAIVRTSDINEDLGLVTHLFCDKTGTLTQNVMIFRQYCHNGKVYNVQDCLVGEDYNSNVLIKAMVLCHSVEVTLNGGQFVASSPDEKAIVEALSCSGFQFGGERPDGTVLVSMVNNEVYKWKRLVELPFDSYRKCMSVIARDDQDTIHVFVKGAESVMLPMCRGSCHLQTTGTIIDNFACDGLRTLVYGHKVISRQQYIEFSDKLAKARQSIVNRVKYLRNVYKEMEAGLELLGATGIEDRLQDKVVDTMYKLRQAGIVTWMLTGDKKETALNLANAAGMIEPPSKLVDLTEVQDKESLVMLINQLTAEYKRQSYSPNASLVVDGKAVAVIARSQHLKAKVSDISSRCRTVIACRLSPVQKSQLVRMVKEACPDNRTCAIGDGGNDVSMIQEAHVGLGIIGREGSAASQAADFAFSKFSQLQRILLVHGHWYYTRLAILVQYSFYKNIVCFACQFYYAIFSNFSGMTLYESLFLFLYNTLYTAVPIVVYGLTEQRYSADLLLNRPELYRENRANSLLTSFHLTKWMLLALWHSLVCFFVWVMAWGGAENRAPQGHDLNSLGAVVAAATVTVVNLKVLLEARHWNWILVTTTVWSIVSYVAGTLVYDSVVMDNSIVDNYDVFYTYIHMFTDSVVTNVATTVLIIVLALIPDFVMLAFKNVGNRRRHQHHREPIYDVNS